MSDKSLAERFQKWLQKYARAMEGLPIQAGHDKSFIVGEISNGDVEFLRALADQVEEALKLGTDMADWIHSLSVNSYGPYVEEIERAWMDDEANPECAAARKFYEATGQSPPAINPEDTE